MSNVKDQLILFSVMFVIAITVNVMNVMVYSPDHLYFSLPLVYASLYMASTMIWGHQIVHYLQKGHFSITIFGIGVCLSLVLIYVMRNQLFTSPQDWIKRMIPHHSMALTTTANMIQNNDLTATSYIYNLGKGIIYSQEKEILFMDNMLI